MRNRDIREVFFCGHGDSHTFMLDTDTCIYYCEFDEPECEKELVHQAHCGTPHGKRLIDYVVPKENHDQCVVFNKSVYAKDIRRAFQDKTKAILAHNA